MTTPRFNRAVAALVKGYLNGTLAKNSRCGGAAGHLVAYSTHRVVIRQSFNQWRYSGGERAYWRDMFLAPPGQVQKIRPESYVGRTRSEIDATGYSWYELSRIERAFERATRIGVVGRLLYTRARIEADQYRGLVAVFRILCEMEGIDDSRPYVALLSRKVTGAVYPV